MGDLKKYPANRSKLALYCTDRMKRSNYRSFHILYVNTLVIKKGLRNIYFKIVNCRFFSESNIRIQETSLQPRMESVGMGHQSFLKTAGSQARLSLYSRDSLNCFITSCQVRILLLTVCECKSKNL